MVHHRREVPLSSPCQRGMSSLHVRVQTGFSYMGADTGGVHTTIYKKHHLIL